MRRVLLLLIFDTLVLLGVASAQTAHVVSVQNHNTSGMTSTYNTKTNSSSYGTTHSWQRITEVRVGNMIYDLEGNRPCTKKVLVGSDYPYTYELDKHQRFKNAKLLVDGKYCAYKVTGVREVQ